MKLDTNRMKEDLRALARESRELKTLLGARWEAPMGDAQRRLCLVRSRTTELLVCRAHFRGRLHVARKPRGFTGETWDPSAYAARVAARVAEEYVAEAIPEAAPAEVA